MKTMSFNSSIGSFIIGNTRYLAYFNHFMILKAFKRPFYNGVIGAGKDIIAVSNSPFTHNLFSIRYLNLIFSAPLIFFYTKFYVYPRIMRSDDKHITMAV